MLTSPRVMIASAFGRGHWMAVALHRLGFNVQLVDVTARLGHFRPEDQEGPFGHFASPRWDGIETEALESLGALTEQEQGFSLWLKSGPWDLRGPTAHYRGEALQQKEQVMQFVRYCAGTSAERKTWLQKIQNLDFDQRWLASLACDLLSHESGWPNEAFLKAPPEALFERFFYRRPETFSVESSLRWCAAQGVIVTENADIPDVALENRRVQGIEVKAAKSGFVRCHQLVWLLNSQETAHLSPRAFLKLYKGQSLDPEWCWLRYELQFEDSKELELLPKNFLFLEDFSIPWSHDNFAVFREGINKGCFHVWLRLPYSQRFHREYLVERIQPLIENIYERCPRLQAKVVGLPAEAASTSKELGAPLFPVYRAADLANPPGLSFLNLWYSHSERWSSYSPTAIFTSQAAMIAEMQQWWGRMSEEQKQKELHL